jgi:predicted component of type VI protein secretion system
MKLSLVVLAEGPQKGKVLEIKLPQFLVGRDPQCQLRPASAMISKRHCALIQRDNKAFVRDFDSTNGTFVNDQPVKGEIELRHGDKLKIGPLLFSIRLEPTAAPVNRPTPPPPTKSAVANQPAATAPASKPAVAAAPASPPPPASATPLPATKPAPAPAESPDEDAAALLLSMGDDGDNRTSGFLSEVPEGSTVFDMASSPGTTPDKAETKEEKAKAALIGNTSSAAKSILEKYMRRPRS